MMHWPRGGRPSKRRCEVASFRFMRCDGYVMSEVQVGAHWWTVKCGKRNHKTLTTHLSTANTRDRCCPNG